MANLEKANPVQCTSEATPRMLMGLATRVRNEDGSFSIRFFWGRIGIVFLALMIVGWLSLSAAIFFYFKYGRAEFDAMTYPKALLLLFRLDEHRRELGDYHVERGLARLEEGELRDGLQLLRVGVTRSPGNIEGRIVLSQVYIEGYRKGLFPEGRVLDVVEAGLPYGMEDLEYMQFYFQTLLFYEEDARVIEVAEKILSESSEQTQRSKLSALAAAQAYFFLGKYSRAEDLIRDYDLMQTVHGLELSAKIKWNRGQKQTAITMLKSSLNMFSNNELIFDLIISFYRQLEEYDKVRYYSILYSTSAPLSYKPRIGLLYAYHGMGEEEAEADEIKLITYQFEGKPQELLALANFATETKNVSLSEWLYEMSLEDGIHTDHFAINLIQCYLEAGHYDRVVRFTEELREENPEWLEWDPIPGMLSSLLAVTYSAKGEHDLSQFQLKQFLQEKIRIDTMLRVADLLTRHGDEEQALLVLLDAYRKAPDSPAVLVPLIQAELLLRRTENLSRYLKQFFKTRQPSPEVLEDIYTRFCSDHFIFVPDRKLLLMEMETILQSYNTRFPLK